MLIKIVTVGKLKDKAIQNRCNEFAKWLSAYAKVEQVELPDSNPNKEGIAILKLIEQEKNSIIISLSEDGQEFNSIDFSEKLKSFDRKAVFIIGGPYGLIDDVKKHSHLLWALSKLTFTHELAKLLLYEQLYRAMNIINGGKYHNN